MREIMNKIIIVESPSKSKTIESYMGGEYKVLSSKGHVRDLAISGVGGLGIDVNHNFKPNYINIPEKKALIEQIKKECAGKEVYIATDPDREGEAIGWHLAVILGLDMDELNRIEFNEITKPAILEAFNHPRKIDKNLVSSQETRRIIDRIIGFKLSTLLQNKIKSKSAGRVQSVALKLIVDLEKEIRAFVPEEYYEITALFDKFEAEFVRFNGEKIDLKTKEEADHYLSILGEDFTVRNIETKINYRESKPPYITSTLQQDASTKLNMTSTKTMRVAQSLYEGKETKDGLVGLITYMRTDSDRLSKLFVDDCFQYIEKEFGHQYVGHPKHKDVLQSQDAHEAIRPTSLLRTPESVKDYLTRDEYRLYHMIYMRALASLMAPASFETQKVDLDNNGLTFRANGNRMVFDGYLKVYSMYAEKSESFLPKLNIGDVIKAKEITSNQHFTKAPSRYTEAKLIKDMEELGIGRPSTYAQTMQTIKNRDYVHIEEKKFIPTEQGILTVEKLDEFFSRIINVKYTANMENVLDEIARGEKRWNEIVAQFYHAFIPMVEKATKNMEAVRIAPVETDEVCPKCGNKLVIRKGRYGEFLACSAFPKCKYIKKDEQKPVDELALCPACGTGHIVERVAKKGRNKGNTFYACDNYPKCKSIFLGIPIGEKCSCGDYLVQTKDGIVCQNPKCPNK